MKRLLIKLLSIYCITLALFFANNHLNAEDTLVLPSADYWPTNGWRHSTPEEQGMVSAKLADMLEYVKKKRYAIDSITIIRNGYIVTDAYLNPLFKPAMKHNMKSATKSITSALIGIAIDKGFIKSVEQNVLEIFPTKKFTNMDDRKKAITIEHLLTMSHGIRTLDSPIHKWQGLIEMSDSKDWVQFILDQPMDAMPGKRYDYSNMSSFLLSAIIHKRTNTTALDFAREYLFEPLGITDVKWPANPNGINKGWGEMWLTPHAMAKIGWLFLNNGYWETRQIVSAEWIRDSTKRITSPKAFRKVIGKNGKFMFYRSVLIWIVNAYILSGIDGYGYQWWVDDSGSYAALGVGGQSIIVIPERNMVVVFTGALKFSQLPKLRMLLDKYIVPSVSSEKEIPPNTGEFKRHNSLLRTTDNGSKPKGETFLPEIAQRISGRTYLYDHNWLDFERFSLTFEQGQNVATMKMQGGNDNGPLRMGLDTVLRIGLDDVFRFTDIDGALAAFRGNWVDKNAFQIFYELIGDIPRGRLCITFEKNKMTQAWNDNAYGKIEFTGQAEDQL